MDGAPAETAPLTEERRTFNPVGGTSDLLEKSSSLTAKAMLFHVNQTGKLSSRRTVLTGGKECKQGNSCVCTFYPLLGSGLAG